jgi:hypothetical protein
VTSFLKEIFNLIYAYPALAGHAESLPKGCLLPKGLPWRAKIAEKRHFLTFAKYIKNKLLRRPLQAGAGLFVSARYELFRLNKNPAKP